MKAWLRRLRCVFGHDWRTVYRSPDCPGRDLVCERCDAKGFTSYDMCYGETVIVPGHYWREAEEAEG